MYREEFHNTKNWSKRFLPHYNAAQKYQLITYRLADSLPQEVLKSLGARHSDAGNTSTRHLGARHSDAGNEEQEV